MRLNNGNYRSFFFYLTKLYVTRYFLSSLPHPPLRPFLITRLLSRRGHPSKLNARHLNRSAIRHKLKIIITIKLVYVEFNYLIYLKLNVNNIKIKLIK